MAAIKLKLAFFGLVVACAVQNALAMPQSAAQPGIAAMSREVEILNEAAVEIVKSFKEFLDSLKRIILEPVLKQFLYLVMNAYLKIHMLVTAAGIDDSSLGLTNEELKEYRIVAKTVIRLRQRLDTMERLEEVFNIDTIEAEMSDFGEFVKSRELQSLVKLFSAKLDERLKQHPDLGPVYRRVRASVEKQYRDVDLSPFNFHTMVAEKLPTHFKVELMTAVLSKQFLHHTLRRVIVVKEEYFVMARSTVELAKKSNYLPKVQQIYDQALSQATLSLDYDTSNVFARAKALFEKLKENFEKHPSLNQEWRIIQKNISPRHDWDRGIWDLDLMPW